VGQNIQPTDAVWEGWPDNVQEIPNFDLNEDAENPPELNLNEVPDMQEMIIDQVIQGPQHHEMFLELNDLLNQVNEEDEDEHENNVALDPIQEDFANALNDPPAIEVNIPILDGSADNFMPLEIQEDDLMNDAEIH